MPDLTPSFTIDDSATFDANLEAFFTSLAAIDPALAVALRIHLPDLLRDEVTRDEFLDALLHAAEESEQP
jgi:hypothetical protein